MSFSPIFESALIDPSKPATGEARARRGSETANNFIVVECVDCCIKYFYRKLWINTLWKKKCSCKAARGSIFQSLNFAKFLRSEFRIALRPAIRKLRAWRSEQHYIRPTVMARLLPRKVNLFNPIILILGSTFRRGTNLKLYLKITVLYSTRLSCEMVANRSWCHRDVLLGELFLILFFRKNSIECNHYWLIPVQQNLKDACLASNNVSGADTYYCKVP